jgi:hypothetical protein
MLCAAAQIKEQHESKIREALNELHALWNRLGTTLESGYEGVVHDISEQKVVLIQQKVVEANADIVRSCTHTNAHIPFNHLCSLQTLCCFA